MDRNQFPGSFAISFLPQSFEGDVPEERNLRQNPAQKQLGKQFRNNGHLINKKHMCCEMDLSFVQQNNSYNVDCLRFDLDLMAEPGRTRNKTSPVVLILLAPTDCRMQMAQERANHMHRVSRLPAH